MVLCVVTACRSHFRRDPRVMFACRHTGCWRRSKMLAASPITSRSPRGLVGDVKHPNNNTNHIEIQMDTRRIHAQLPVEHPGKHAVCMQRDVANGRKVRRQIKHHACLTTSSTRVAVIRAVMSPANYRLVFTTND